MTDQEPSRCGTFVWREIMSEDPARTIEFYTRLLGWITEETDLGEHGTYTVFKAGDRAVAGAMGHVGPSHVPAYWLAYVSVGDVDETAAQAAASGGAVLVPGMDIPDMGRFAVIRDPQGAHVAVYARGGEESPAPPEPGAGEFCWDELATTDPEASVPFYAQLFGWGMKSADMGAGRRYWTYTSGGRSAAGMMAMPPNQPFPPFWLSYVSVADVDATAARAGELGGVVRVPPADLPGVGRFAVLADPHGALFGIFAAPSAT
ncbi:MAG: VOC family protein [Candidatus Krumholzibacteriota bacterium]|nr:VOC family protein [Candidatus Krumholzibacteriota bacterium]